MFYPLSAFIAYRYARSRPANSSGTSSFVSFINRFSVAGIALGLMALIIVLSVMNGFEGQLKKRILGIVPHIEIMASVDNEYLKTLPNVVSAMPFREAEAVVQSRSQLRGVQLHGIEPDSMIAHTDVAKAMQQGDFSFLDAGSFNVIIGRALAVHLDVNVGDRLRVMVTGASVYTPFGRMPSQRLVNVVGVFDMGSQMDDKVIYMHLNDLNRLLRDVSGDKVSTRLFLTDPFLYQQTLQHIEQDNFPAHTWRERQGPLFDAVKMEKNMMFLMLLLIIAVAAFNLVSSLVMVVSQKQGDIAVLQTQGMSPSAIMSIFVLNGLFNGLKGAIIGVIAGVVITLELNTILEVFNLPVVISANEPGLPIKMDALQITSVTLFSLLLCVLASIYPARRAMKVQPSQVLQNE